MTKQEQKDILFSLNIAYGYIKTYGQDKDYDRNHILMHLKPIIEIIEKDKEEKPKLAYGIYNNIKDKDTPKNN